MRVLDSARLKHRIEWQRATTSKTATAAVTKSWDPILVTWAEIKPVTTREYVLAAQVQHEISHRVTIRYDERLAEMAGEWRGVFNGRYLHVTGAPRNVDEENVLIEIDCIEGLKDE